MKKGNAMVLFFIGLFLILLGICVILGMRYLWWNFMPNIFEQYGLAGITVALIYGSPLIIIGSILLIIGLVKWVVHD